MLIKGRHQALSPLITGPKLELPTPSPFIKFEYKVGHYHNSIFLLFNFRIVVIKDQSKAAWKFHIWKNEL